MPKILSNVLWLTLIFFIGCATDRPEGKTEAEKLFKEAQEYEQDKRYLLALEKLNTIRSQHPYSFYATHAELMQADIFFKQENFVESAAAYILFRDFHPRHEKIPYVIQQIAESFYKQIPEDIDRDLSSALEAIKYFKEIIEKYSTSDYAESSKKRLDEVEYKLEQKEKYIADFYFKTKVYDAARYRYLEILNLVKDQEIKEHAVVRILMSSRKLKDKDSCLKHAALYLDTLTQGYKSKAEDIFKECQAL
jgi:outer membrane protein assembly factor BamD